MPLPSPVLLHLQGGGEGGHQPGLWDILFSGWREERQHNGGELRALWILFSNWTYKLRQETRTLSMTTMTTWRATCTMQSGTIIPNTQSVKWSKIQTIIFQFICNILTIFNKTLFDLLWIEIMLPPSMAETSSPSSKQMEKRANFPKMAVNHCFA